MSFKKFTGRNVTQLATGFAALAAVVVFAATGHSKGQPLAGANTPGPEVTVAEVIHQPLREWQEFTGRLQAVNTVEIRPRVSGYVDRVAFEDGTRVKKGQLLFQIDPRPFQAEVERLVAERSRSVSDFELAKANHARAERLIGAHAISREEYERLVAAEASAQGALGSIDASLREARLNREFTEVRTPIDGHVSRAIITAGNLVTSASLLTTVVSDDPVYVYFDADEQTYLRFAKARRDAHAGDDASGVYLGLVDEEGYPHAGRLDFIDNQVDPTTGTLKLKAEFPNGNFQLWPGQFVNVRLKVDTLTQATVVPTSSVQRGPAGTFSYVIGDGDIVTAKPVVVTQQNETDAVVTSGLSPSDRVVTTGFANLSDGAKVIIGKEEQTPTADLAPRKKGSRAPQGKDGQAKDGPGKGGKKGGLSQGEGDQKGQIGPAQGEQSGSATKSQP